MSGLGRPDPRVPASWCHEGVAHDHRACGTLWDSTSRRDIEQAARWADSLRDTRAPADARRAAENLRSPYLCNWDPGVAQALAELLEESAAEAEAGRANARAALVARRLLESWGMVGRTDEEPTASTGAI